MSGFFHNILKNIFSIFGWPNFLWHLLAIGLTYIFVASGLDWRYFQATRGEALQKFLWPAVFLGFLIPLFGILTFWGVSALAKKRRAIFIAYALGQAAILGLFVSDFFKIFTGRPGPPDVADGRIIIDTSHIFRFGILRGGVFFGWPSSHTTIAMAMAAALWVLFPKNKTIKFLAAFYAIYIGLGVSATIHWFSDFAAGAIFGIVIGVVVGKSFRKKYFLRV